MNWIQRFLCKIGRHPKLRIVKHLKGDRFWGVRIVTCDVCHHYFIMSDEHRAFLRYDNDLEFQKDIKLIYGLKELL